MRDGVPQVTLRSGSHFSNQGNNNMINARKFAFLGMALAICAFAVPAGAQSVTHLASPNPGAVIDAAVVVPPGYTTYYISGTPAGPKDPNAPAGSPGRWGDTTQQTDDSLNKL